VLPAVLSPTGPDRWPHPGGMKLAPRRCLGTGAAVLAHALIIVIAARLAIAPPAAAPETAGIPIVFAPPAAPPVPVPLAAASLPTQPSLIVPTPLASRVAPRVFAASSPSAPAPSRPASLSTATAPANPAPEAPPAIVPAENLAELTGFEAQLDAAVRAAAAMPEAARRQHRTGGARLRFHYLDGAVDDVQIVESSQSRVLDDAAITAVRVAHYPAPPVRIRGRRLELLVRIDFRMASPG
jgi:protein TonB